MHQTAMYVWACKTMMCQFEAIAVHSDLRCNCEPHKEWPIVQHCFDMQNVHIPPVCSFQASTNHVYLNEIAGDACRESQLPNRISHAALIQKIDIPDNRATVRYAECPYVTCTLRLTQRKSVLSESLEICTVCMCAPVMIEPTFTTKIAYQYF